MTVAPEKVEPLDAASFELGHVIDGRYKVSGLLGKGGFGAVYLAVHQQLHREVAVKVLLPQLADNAEVVARFIREARSTASIGHPGIVEVFDLGSDEGGVYLAMEKLDGEELHDRIERESPLPVQFVARVGMEIADAVHAAHEIGVIHRDLKPQNIFLAKHGHRGGEIVKVLDFGIAKLLEADERNHVHLTRSGQVFGTPLYMSPEQLRGAKDLDVRADVYAIGTILYEALSGRVPFSGETFAELVLRISMETPTPLETLRPDIPPELCEIVRRAMAQDREQRYPAAAALYDALAPFKNHVPNHATGFANTMSAQDLNGGPAHTQPERQTEASLEDESLSNAVTNSNKMWWVGGACVFLIVAAIVFLLDGEPETTITHTAGRATTESSGQAMTSEAGTTREVDSTHESNELALGEEPPLLPPAPTRLIHIQSEPSGVAVFIDGAELCTTPCEESFDGPADLTFRRTGYRSARRSISGTDSRLDVRLLPRVRRPRPPVQAPPPPLIPRLKAR